MRDLFPVLLSTVAMIATVVGVAFIILGSLVGIGIKLISLIVGG
jgi:hypothetical protein